MYTIGREVEVADASAERAILSLIGPRSAEIAGTRAAAGVRLRSDDGRRGRVPRRRHRRRHRPDRRRRRARAPARRAARRRRRRGRPRGGRDPPDRGRHAPLRRRDGRRDDARRGRHRRARGQLHQGLLHRPGDGRPPPLQGQAEPPPARPAAERPGRARAPPCGWARRRSAGSAAPASPPPSGRSALAIVRREAEPGAELAVGEDGVTARSSRPAVRLDSAAMGLGRAQSRGGGRCARRARRCCGAGCGAESHPNEPRPQAPTRVSVTISRRRGHRAAGDGSAIGPEKSQQIPQNQNHAAAADQDQGAARRRLRHRQPDRHRLQAEDPRRRSGSDLGPDRRQQPRHLPAAAADRHLHDLRRRHARARSPATLDGRPAPRLLRRTTSCCLS